MHYSYNDSIRAETLPFFSGSQAFRLDVSTTSAAITLARGVYNMHYSAAPSAIVLCTFDQAAVLPLNQNAAGQPGFFPSPNNPYRFVIESSSSTLNAITVAGSAVLWITKLQ